MFVEEITARSCENMTYAMTNLKKKLLGQCAVNKSVLYPVLKS